MTMLYNLEFHFGLHTETKHRWSVIQTLHHKLVYTIIWLLQYTSDSYKAHTVSKLLTDAVQSTTLYGDSYLELEAVILHVLH